MNSRKTNKIIIGLTILSILVAIIVGFLQYFKQNKSSQVIAGSGNVQVNQEGNNNIVNINKNKIDTIIRSLKFRVRLDSFPKQGITVEEGMSMGPANIMGLFSDKKIRYRFITDYKWFTSKREDGLQGISFIYNPENPEQIIGKRIDFLKNMDKLVINYSKFFNLKNLNVDKHRPIIFNLDIFLNGIKVISMSKGVPSSYIFNGQVSRKVREYFNDIDDKYKKAISNL